MNLLEAKGCGFIVNVVTNKKNPLIKQEIQFKGFQIFDTKIVSP